MKSDRVELITSDNKKIAADLYPVEKPEGWLLFSHMMPATKESWRNLAIELQSYGYEGLAIDLRGHGESEGGPGGFKNFGDAEHQASIQDIAAGWEFLKSRGAVPEKTVLVGASIGANLSLLFLTKNQEIRGGILLSPGDYKGLDSALLVRQLSPGQKLLLAASKKDERAAGNNADQNRQYYNLAPSQNKKLVVYEPAGHGTDFLSFSDGPDLTQTIKEFLNG